MCSESVYFEASVKKKIQTGHFSIESRLDRIALTAETAPKCAT